MERYKILLDGQEVTVIEKNAFSNCTGITEIVLPVRLNAIEKEAFSECTALTSAVLPSVDTIPARLFSDCNKLHSVVFPEGVETISVQAFWNCAALQSVKFPESLVSIGTSAFVGCGLTSLFIPSKVNHIEMLAFWGTNASPRLQGNSHSRRRHIHWTVFFR